jgi:hypothetical protein
LLFNSWLRNNHCSMQATYYKTHSNLLHVGIHTVIILYILERPSSWSTSRIRPSWPRSRVRLRLLLLLFPKYISCLPRPNQYLAACYNGSCFTLNPSLADCRLNTNVQVNNMTVPHHIHTDTHICITSISLFILLFTLLPLSLAGWLPWTLPVGHRRYVSEGSPAKCKYFIQYPGKQKKDTIFILAALDS